MRPRRVASGQIGRSLPATPVTSIVQACVLLPLVAVPIADAGVGLRTPTSTAGAPTARYLHTAIWTASKMIVWGGLTGGLYDPSAIPTPAVRVDSNDDGHADPWAGTPRP
jgi:hypothetical protein